MANIMDPYVIPSVVDRRAAPFRVEKEVAVESGFIDPDADIAVGTETVDVLCSVVNVVLVGEVEPAAWEDPSV